MTLAAVSRLLNESDMVEAFVRHTAHFVDDCQVLARPLPVADPAAARGLVSDLDVPIASGRGIRACGVHLT